MKIGMLSSVVTLSTYSRRSREFRLATSTTAGRPCSRRSRTLGRCAHGGHPREPASRCLLDPHGRCHGILVAGPHDLVGASGDLAVVRVVGVHLQEGEVRVGRPRAETRRAASRASSSVLMRSAWEHRESASSYSESPVERRDQMFPLLGGAAAFPEGADHLGGGSQHGDLRVVPFAFGGVGGERDRPLAIRRGP